MSGSTWPIRKKKQIKTNYLKAFIISIMFFSQLYRDQDLYKIFIKFQLDLTIIYKIINVFTRLVMQHV